MFSMFEGLLSSFKKDLKMSATQVFVMECDRLDHEVALVTYKDDECQLCSCPYYEATKVVGVLDD